MPVWPSIRQPGTTEPGKREHPKKAYDLRDRVSDREKFRITAYYYQYVTGEVEKATEAYELWAETYPRDLVPHTNLGYIYSTLGQYDKAAAETEESHGLQPSLTGFGNLAGIYMNLNRLAGRRPGSPCSRPKPTNSMAW